MKNFIFALIFLSQMAWANEFSPTAPFKKLADFGLIDLVGTLHRKIEEGGVKNVEEAIKAGANLNLKADFGNTPLHVAVKGEKIEIIELLLKKGALLNEKNNANKAPLHLAVEEGNPRIIKLLVKAGASLSVKDGSGFTPLHYVANYEGKESKSLLEAMASTISKDTINIQSNNGFTALHIASALGHLEIVETLLKFGADWTVTDNEGKSPLDHAISNGERFKDLSQKTVNNFKQIAHLLEQAQKNQIKKNCDLSTK